MNRTEQEPILETANCPKCGKIHTFRPIDTYAVCCGVRIEPK